MADGLLITISANVQPAIAAIKQAGAAVQGFATQVSGQLSGAMTSFSAGVSKAFSSIGKAASVAGSIGKELFLSMITPTAIIAGIALVAKGIYDWATAATSAEKAQQALNKAMDDGRASVQGEIADVHSLVLIAEDESLSRATRMEAMNKLNKEYPETFDNLKLDKTLTDRLTQGEADLTAELIRQAQVKAQIKLIDKAEQTKADIRSAPTEALTLLDKLEIGVKAFTNSASIGGTIASVANERLNETLKTQDLIIKGAKENLLKLNTERAKAGTLFTPPAAKAAKTAKPTDELKQAIADLERLKKISAEFEQNRLLNLKIDLLLRDGKRFTASELSRQIAALVADSGIGSKVTTLPIEIDTRKVTTELATFGRALSAAVNIKPALLKAAADVQSFSDELGVIVEGLKENLAIGLGQALGEALAGGNIKDLLGGFISIFADGLQEIGKAAIRFGILAKAIKIAIKNPTTAIIAGIALVAAGAALKGILNKQRFAQGGIVTGPTNALIGEGGQPEVVFPLNKLNQFIKKIGGGNNTNEITTVSVRGTNLLLAIRRTQNQLGGTFS